MAKTKGKVVSSKPKSKNYLVIVTALVALASFIAKEIVQSSLKDLHDSIAKAESQFRVEDSQSTISLQILTTQEQIDLYRAQDDPERGNLNRDLSTLIQPAVQETRQAQATLDESFDEVSRLVDALPSGASDLRQLRDQTGGRVKVIDKQTGNMLRPSPAHDLSRFVAVKVAMIRVMLEGIDVALLSDVALSRARQVENASGRLVRVCTWLYWILGSFALLLGVYTAVTRGQGAN